MHYLKFLIFVSAILISCKSFAIECFDLDKRSNAYQTCMLRKENLERDLKIENELKILNAIKSTQLKTDAFDNYKKKFDNSMALADVEEAELSTMKALGMPELGNCTPVASQFSAYVLLLCKPGIAFLMATNQTTLAQEFSKDIRDKKIEAIYIAGLGVPYLDNNYVYKMQKTGVALYVSLANSIDIFNTLVERVKKKQPVEFFLMVGGRPFKYLLNNFEDPN